MKKKWWIMATVIILLLVAAFIVPINGKDKITTERSPAPVLAQETSQPASQVAPQSSPQETSQPASQVAPQSSPQETSQPAFIRITTKDLILKTMNNPDYFKGGTVLRVTGMGVKEANPGSGNLQFWIGPETEGFYAVFQLTISTDIGKNIFTTKVNDILRELAASNPSVKIVIEGEYDGIYPGRGPFLYLTSIIFEESDGVVQQINE